MYTQFIFTVMYGMNGMMGRAILSSTYVNFSTLPEESIP